MKHVKVHVKAVKKDKGRSSDEAAVAMGRLWDNVWCWSVVVVKLCLWVTKAVWKWCVWKHLHDVIAAS